MFRSILIYLSTAAWARRLVTRWQFAWRAASRFIAGETLDDAIRTIQSLNARGINATLDHLGEHTSTPDESRRAVQDILRAIDAIQEAGVRANVSIKLTQIGLHLGEELCAENLRTILLYARAKGNFLRVDMEDSPWVDVTLGLYRRMTDCDLENTGMVIQAYLYRSEQDVRGLAAQSGRIRLCKGAYKEPADVAFPKKADVDANYDRLAQIMMDASLSGGAAVLSPDGRFPPPPAFATHDPRRIVNAKAYAERIGLGKTSIEFQMLYGIRRDLQEQTAREGYPVRVYVPYGTEWYPYYMRRLAERPANVWFFISNFFRK
jgi:proline dehydrogenase